MSTMEVEYLEHMGSDLSVVNAARVSFSKRSEWDTVTWYEEEQTRRGHESVKYSKNVLKPADQKLIQYLARGVSTKDWDALAEEAFDAQLTEIYEILRHVRNLPTHWTPFAHPHISIRVKAPIPIARQLFKHKVGFVENEVSRRYVDDPPELYTPKWRKRAADKKQGSSDELLDLNTFWFDGNPMDHLDDRMFGDTLGDTVKYLYEDALGVYQGLIKAGVAPEQARMVLPQAMMTEWVWTGSLYGFASMYNARSDSHAQQETQEVAKAIGNIIRPLFPVSWAALTGESDV